MKPLDNKQYKDALKSVKPEFDQALLWDSIEQGLDKKKKRRKFIFFFFGASIILALCFILPKENLDYQTSEHHNKNIKATTIETTKTEIQKETIQEQVITKTGLRKEDKIEKTKTSNNQSELIKSNLQEDKSIQLRDQAQLPVSKNTIVENSQSTESETTPSIPSTKIESLTEVDFQKTITIDLESKPASISGLSLSTFGLMPRQYTIDSWSILEEKEKEPSIAKNRFLFTANIGRPQSTYRTTEPMMEAWVTNNAAAITDLYSFGASGKYLRAMNEQFSLSVGLQFNRATDRLNTSYTTTEIMSIESDSAVYIINSQGGQDYFPGEQTQTTTTTTRVQHFNHWYSLGVSLGAR